MKDYYILGWPSDENSIESNFLWFCICFVSILYGCLRMYTDHLVSYLRCPLTNSSPLFLYTFKLHCNYIHKVLLLPHDRLPRILAEEIINKKIILA